MLEVSINGQTVSDPIGLDGLNERVYYNDELAMYLNKLDGSLTFVGDGYKVLRDLFVSSVCNVTDVQISDDCTGDVYEGVIFLNDVTWNLSKCEAEATIVSDKFIQQINNNKGIKVQLGVGLSKDLQSITTTSQTVTLPSDDGTTSVNGVAYRVFDVFNELIEFMTNGELTFVSDYFDYNAPTSDACYDVIITGEEVRTQNGETTPLISYRDFFEDMNKLHNLAGVIEGNTLRLEPKEYFRQTGTSVTLDNINDVTQETNREQFYASIKMGSAKVAEGFGFLIRLSFNGFQQEQFFLQGECNIENELDLETQKLITDTNIIQDVLPVAQGGTANDQYDEDIFIIHCNNTNTAIVTDAPLTPRFYYNEYYTNRYVAERWAGTYPFSITQLLETLSPLVQATLTANQTDSTNPTSISFSPDNDSTGGNFDTGGDYQIGIINTTPIFTENIGYFEAPTDMVVSVDVDFAIRGAYWYTQIEHVDSSGNIQTPPVLIDVNPFVSISQQYYFFNYRRIIGGTTLYMPAGTRCFIRILALSGTIVYSGGVLEVVQTGSFGGIYKLVNENTAFTSRTSFQYPVDGETWQQIKSEPYKRIEGSYIDGGLSGFPIDISRNLYTSETDVELYQKKQDING